MPPDTAAPTTTSRLAALALAVCAEAVPASAHGRDAAPLELPSADGQPFLPPTTKHVGMRSVYGPESSLGRWQPHHGTLRPPLRQLVAPSSVHAQPPEVEPGYEAMSKDAMADEHATRRSRSRR